MVGTSTIFVFSMTTSLILSLKTGLSFSATIYYVLITGFSIIFSTSTILVSIVGFKIILSIRVGTGTYFSSIVFSINTLVI